MSETDTLRIDTWNDIVCPWCYVGEARLAGAIERSGREVAFVPHAFELDPQHAHPERVIDMLSRKYGRTEDEARAMDARVAEMAVAEGLPYSSDRVTANTFDAHRLVAAARAEGIGGAVLHALQRGHFSGELDLSDADALVATVAAAGLDAERARAVLGSDEYADEVRADEAQARDIGVTGVPFTVVGGAYAIPGCGSPEQYDQVIERAVAEAATA